MSFDSNPRKKINKKRFLFVVLALGLVLTMAAVTFWGGRAVSAKEDYSELKIFTEVLQTVKADYVRKAGSQKLIYSAIKGMVDSLDPHSGFMTPGEYKDMQADTSGQFGGLGIEIGVKDATLTVIAPIEDTPAYKAGIKPGDRIVAIDGQPTGSMTLMDAVKKMRGPKGTPVTLSIMREGFKAPRDFKIVRAIIKVKSVKWKVLDKKSGIGYIKLSEFQEKTAAQLAGALKQLKGQGVRSIVLDLRNNPGGLLNSAVDVASQFLPKGKLVVSIKGRTGAGTDFNTTDTYPRYTHMPIVVLVNQGSASAAEIVTGALKDWRRAVIMGTPTFGKGSVQTVIPFSDGSALRLTTAMYYTPNGKSIQDTGITPDIVVKLEIAKGQKEYPYIREKDLKNHFYFKGSQQKLETQGHAETMEKMKMAPLVPRNEKNDNQLQRAVDLLRGLNVFEKVSKAA